jgi:hypothetical protein
MGQLLFEIDIEHYQGPEDFYPVNPPPLEDRYRCQNARWHTRARASVNLQE